MSVAEAGGARVGLASLVPYGGHDDQFGSLTSVPEVPAVGDLVLGTVDGSWRIDRISQDVTSLLGINPTSVRAHRFWAPSTHPTFPPSWPLWNMPAEASGRCVSRSG